MGVFIKETREGQLETKAIASPVIIVLSKFLLFIKDKFSFELNFSVLHFNQTFFYYAFLVPLRKIFPLKVVRHKSHFENPRKKYDRPIILISNHISNWDSFIILCSMQKHFFFNHLLWRIPAYYRHFKERFHYFLLYKFTGCYPLEKKETIEKTLEGTIKILSKGHSTIFFPEGRRVSFGENAEPKKGISYLATNVSAYILPVYLEYSKRGKNGFGARFGKTKIIYGQAIKSEYFVDNFSQEHRHFAIMEKVYELRQFA